MDGFVLSIFSLISFLGLAYGMNCSSAISKHESFIPQMNHIITDSDCPPMRECCQKDSNGVSCCSIIEYLADDGSHLIFPFILSVAGIVLLVTSLVSLLYICYDYCCLHSFPKRVAFVRMA